MVGLTAQSGISSGQDRGSIHQNQIEFLKSLLASFGAYPSKIDLHGVEIC